MYELKGTEAESIGRFAKALRFLLVLTFTGSVFVGIFWSTLVGMIVMGVSALGLSFLTGRVYVIQNLYRIETIVKLREKLLDHAENEFILNDIKKDQLWRGEEVDPNVEKRLAEITALRDKFHDHLLKAVTDLFDDMKPTADPKKTDPN